MNATLSRASRLLCATTLALMLLAAPAYKVDTPFTPRFAQTVRATSPGREHADDLPNAAPGAPPPRAAAAGR